MVQGHSPHADVHRMRIIIWDNGPEIRCMSAKIVQFVHSAHAFCWFELEAPTFDILPLPL